MDIAITFGCLSWRRNRKPDARMKATYHHLHVMG
jgi:hypothetical protein